MIRILVLVMVIAGGWQLASGGWIWAKALLAQRLLEQSWSQMQLQHHNGNAEVIKPWPWADTHATARLEVPELAINMIVLQGDSGRTLAFGPGQSNDSVAPGELGTTVISGHRDTHFSFMRDLKTNMKLRLQTLDRELLYRVREARIIDSRQGGIIAPEEDYGLLLVTCYPFDSIEPGGPLRYLVWAEAEPQPDQRKPPSPLISAIRANPASTLKIIL
ncbi:MAG: class GN sortase [Motiliproteus sp.]